MPVRTVFGLVGEQWCRHPMIMPLNCKFQSVGSTCCHHTGDASKCLQACGRAGRVASGLLGLNQLEEACTRLSGRGIPVHDVPSTRGNTAMLARIRAGGRRFIAAASGPREARSPAAHGRLASCATWT